MNKPMRSKSGRWFRRGSSIVLVLPEKSRPGSGEESEAPNFNAFIHPNIDVSAQRALMSMASSSNPVDAARASSILGWVQQGRVGIYQQDQQRPALLARDQLHKGWWELLPPGKNSDYECDRSGVAVFFFRKNLSRPLLIVELRSFADSNGMLGPFCGQ